VPAGEQIAPFRVAVPEDVLVDLRERLARTRLPETLEDSGWGYGTDITYLRELITYWRDGYDWRVWESKLNDFPQFWTTVNGLALHFLHVRSPHPDAMPLLITHGWPGSVFEFHKIIGPLTDPTRHGRNAADAFHLVCPSIPGYGWSQAPKRSGFGIRQIADGEIELMSRLGYDRYAVQGGDWGATISAAIGQRDPSHVVGVHLNMTAFLGQPAQGADEGLSAQERGDVDDLRAWAADGSAYMQLQATRPQTLAFGLADSPAGLAAWIVEKFRAWSDCGGDIASRFTMDELLTNIMIYWTNNAVDSSLRLYRERRLEQLRFRVDVPVAVAVFPREMSRFPRAWVEPHVNLQRWTRMPRGGHFAAFEEPELLADDVREFFRSLR
jgi:pimeloyl-ACP methyl ester carboxylesterase